MKRASGLLILSFLICICSCSDPTNFTDKELICYPDKMLEKGNRYDIKIIENLRAKEVLNYADCIQLAIFYSTYDESPELVYYWLKTSIRLNEVKSCETLEYLDSKNFFEYSSAYHQKLESVLRECNPT